MKTLVIMENLDRMDDPVFNQWIGKNASEMFEKIIYHTGMLSYGEEEYKKLFADISTCDAIAAHTSLNNFNQFKKLLDFINGLKRKPKVYLSYMLYNGLTDFLNKHADAELVAMITAFIEANPATLYEICARNVPSEDSDAASYFKTEHYAFKENELISSNELLYITHAQRKRKTPRTRISYTKVRKQLKENIKKRLCGSLDTWGFSESDIKAICSEIDAVKK